MSKTKTKRDEPKIVQEIRDKILNTFNELVFVEEGHKYFLRGVEYECVSNVTHHFKRPENIFQPIPQSIKYAEKHGETPEFWLAKWQDINDYANYIGTLAHEYGESKFHEWMGELDKVCPSAKYKFLNGKLRATSPKEEAVDMFWSDIPDSLWPVLVETKVYTDNPDFKSNYAGTFDMLFYFDGNGNPDKAGLYILDYKGLPLDTPIATISGWKNMGDLNIGDIVFDKDGNPTSIVHVSDIHYNPCYKIIFNNKEEIVADCDHRWLITFVKGKKKIEKIMTTSELASYVDDLNKSGKRKNSSLLPKIVVNKPLNCTFKQLPIDPYVLGVWLGDGHSTCGMITNMYEEVWNEIKKRGYKIGNDVSQGGAGKAQSRTVFKLIGKLKNINVLNNKHIPDLYMRSSFGQRLDLLRGIMDADGHYNDKRKRYVFATTRLKHAEFVKILVDSLGIKSTLIPCTKICNGKKIPGYDVCFSTDIYMFLARNVNVHKHKSNHKLFRNIRSVNKVETVPTKCIEVDSPTHTFLAGTNLIVTHNTNKELKNQFADQMLAEPFEYLPDQNLSFYYLQLAAYQIPLEDIGLKVLARRIIYLKSDGTYEKYDVPDLTKELRKALSK